MARTRLPYVALVAILLATAGCLSAQSPQLVETEGGPDPLQSLRDLSIPDGRPMAQGLEALQAADRARIGDLPEPAPLEEVDLIAAIHLLADRNDHTLTADERHDLLLLAGLPRSTASALGTTIAAFTDLSEVTEAAFTNGPPDDLAPLLVSQHRFVQAVAGLEAAVAQHGSRTTVSGLDEALTLQGARTAAAPITIGGVLALDLDGEDTHYINNYLLVIDLGGEDLYENNAGGNQLDPYHCNGEDTPIPSPRPPLTAALVDLAGHDHYLPERSSCAVNGGGAYGVGMILDADGNDTYVAASLGTNGGAFAHGIGLVLDTQGNDTFEAEWSGANGGGHAGGYGRLIDLRGDDQYTAVAKGANGGASGGHHCVNRCEEVRTATGLLLDLGGTDHYYDIDWRETKDETIVPKGIGGALIDVALLQ